MFNLFKNKTTDAAASTQTVKINLKNLDCPSCAVDLDLTLEEQPGIISAKTNYAKSEIKISFDPQKTEVKDLKKTITSLGYL